MILAGAIAAVAMLFLLFKFNLRRVVSFDIMLDIVITFFFIWIFAGTFAGMMAAIIGGLIVSVVLVVLKRLIPRQKYGFIKTDKFPYCKTGWKTINP